MLLLLEHKTKPPHNEGYTDKKVKKIFLIHKNILKGLVVKSYMTNGLLIYGSVFAHFLVY